MDIKAKQIEIAKNVVKLTSESLCQIDMELNEDNARALIQEISGKMNEEALMRNDSKFVALQVIKYLANNALQYKEYDALCMFAISIAWGAKGYSEERSLPEAEAKFVEKMKTESLELVAKNRQFVKSQVAQNFIDSSILMLCFKTPFSD